MRLIARLFSIATFTLASPPSTAWACSCGAMIPSREIIPADQEQNVPTNVTLRVFLVGFDPRIRAALVQEYRLRDEQQQLVELVGTVETNRIDLRPRQPLRPNTRYTVERIFAYNPRGTLLQDEERMRATREDPLSVRRVWFASSTFRTGTSEATSSRVVPELTNARVYFRYGGGDCGPGIALGVEATLPTGSHRYSVARLETRTAGVPSVQVASRPATTTLSFGVGNVLCVPDPVPLPLTQGLQARVVLLDATGNEIGASGWSTALHGAVPAAQRSTDVSFFQPRTPMHDWFARTEEPMTASNVPRPRSCPHGLEIVSSSELTTGTSSSLLGSRARLLSNGERIWYLLEPLELHRNSTLLSWDAGAVPSVLTNELPPRITEVATIENTLLWLSEQHTTDGQHRHTFTRTNTEGSQLGQWQTASEAQLLFAAGGRDSALIAFRSGVLPNEQLEWAVLTNGTLGPTHHIAVPRTRIHARGAWLGRRYVLAWNQRDESMRTARIHLAFIAPNGTLEATQALQINAVEAFDLLATEEHIALVTEAEGSIHFSLLDHAGTLLRGPSNVSTSVGNHRNRAPHVAHRNGLFAISWETHQTNHAFATVADTSANVAPATQISTHAARETSIAANGAHRFVVVHNVPESPSVAPQRIELRCRTSPPATAPTQIAPISSNPP